MAASASAIRAGRAFVELFADDSKLVRGLRAAQAKLQAWGTAVQQIGRDVFFAGSLGVGAFFSASKVFSTVGDELQKMALRTGLSVEQVSALSHAAGLSATSLEEVENGVRKMRRAIDQGSSVFQRLGLSLDQLREMTPQEQLEAIADSLSAIHDPAERAVDVFGQRGANLIPLLAGGSAGLREMAAEAQRLGLVMNDAEANSAAALNDALGTLWAQLKMTVAMIGSAVAPALTSVLRRSQTVIAAVVEWVRANRPLLANLFALAVGVAAVGGGIMGLGVSLKLAAFSIGPLIRGMQLFAGGVNLAIRAGVGLARILGVAVVPLLRSVVTAVVAAGQAFATMLAKGVAAGAAAAASGMAALLTPIGVLGVALVGIGGTLVWASGLFGDLLQAGKNTWNTLKSTAIEAWGAIGAALARGDLQAAADVAWTGLKLVWTQATGDLKLAWTKFTLFLKEVFARASNRLAEILTESMIGIQRGWAEFTSGLGELWTNFTAGLRKAWHSSIGFIQKAWTRLKALFDADINVEAEVERINAETDASRSEIDTERDQVNRERQERLQKELADLERTRRQMLESLQQQGASEIDALERQRLAAIEEQAERLRQAREAFQSAVETARSGTEAEGPRPRAIAALEEDAAPIARRMEQVNRAVELFSADAQRAIAQALAPSRADPARRAAVQTAANTARAADGLEEQVAETRRIRGQLSRAPVLATERV